MGCEGIAVKVEGGGGGKEGVGEIMAVGEGEDSWCGFVDGGQTVGVVGIVEGVVEVEVVDETE